MFEYDSMLKIKTKIGKKSVLAKINRNRTLCSQVIALNIQINKQKSKAKLDARAKCIRCRQYGHFDYY